MVNLSVVIPAYNEEDNIEAAIQEVVKMLPDAEIIVVDDASTDKTLQILQRVMQTNHNLKVLSNRENKGHGCTVVEGLLAAQGEYILYIDADRQIELKNLRQIDSWDGEFDFLSGWRLHRNDKPFRKFISFCLKMTNLIFHQMYIKDANCPFKLYKRSKLLPLLNELPNTHIIPIADLEVLARKHKLITITIPTPHLPYDGVRKGFLQAITFKSLRFFSSAFFEIVKL